VDDDELGLSTTAVRALIAAYRTYKPKTHLTVPVPKISLRTGYRPVTGKTHEPHAMMSSQYLCGTQRPDTQHVTHEVLVADRQGQQQTVRALIDCGATSTFISQRLCSSLKLETKPAHVDTYGLDGKLLASARDSLKTSISVQYFPHLAPVEESEVLVVPIEAYDLVLGLPWFKARDPGIDWAKARLHSIRTQGPDDENRIQRSAEECSGGVKIEMLSATAMVNLLARKEVETVLTLKVRTEGRESLMGTATKGKQSYHQGKGPEVRAPYRPGVREQRIRARPWGSNGSPGSTSNDPGGTKGSPECGYPAWLGKGRKALQSPPAIAPGRTWKQPEIPSQGKNRRRPLLL
jgi:Aspartyl protease